MIGQQVGSYRIVSQIAEGGMGVVYRGEHTMIGRLVAIKVLLPELSQEKEIITRFFNEAKAATAVRHPNIVEIFDFGYMPSGQAYLVMELLEGEPVSDRLKRIGKMGEGEAAKIIRITTSALAAAHAQGIVHRDLKPDNLFLCPDPGIPGSESPKLLDFGIAKLTGPANAQSGQLTRVGTVLGTPTYMAPEQCRGAPEIDHRADLYSLGCILFELVTGRPPFTSQNPGELLVQHLVTPPPSPRSLVPGLSAAFEAVIMKLLAKEPNDRYASAIDLGKALEPLVPAPPPAPGWTPAPIAGAFDQAPTQLASMPPSWAAPPRLPHQQAPMPEPMQPRISAPMPVQQPPPMQAYPSAPPAQGAYPSAPPQQAYPSAPPPMQQPPRHGPYPTPPPMQALQGSYPTPGQQVSYPTPPPGQMNLRPLPPGSSASPDQNRRSLLIVLGAVLLVGAIIAAVLIASG